MSQSARIANAPAYLVLVIHPAGKHARVRRTGIPEPEALIRAITSPGWVTVADVLKDEGCSSVLAGETPAGPVVVKSMTLDRHADAIKRALRVTRFERQWRGAEALARRGFLVARPLLLWIARDESGRPVESLAMERLSGKTVLRHMAERGLPPLAEVALARALGEQAARLAMLGLVHRDHKPSNLLVVGTDPPRIAILDTVAIRRSRRWPALVRMLFDLIVEPVGCGVAPPMALQLASVRAAVRAAGLRRIDAARLWHDVRTRLMLHGDPRPKVDPLG